MILLPLALVIAQEIPPPPTPLDCDGLGHGIAYEPAIARQGETVTLTLMRVKFHGMPFEPLPDECASEWKSLDKGGKLIRDRRTGTHKLRIDKKAVPGSRIRFFAKLPGDDEAHGSLVVIGATQKVLSGKFRIHSHTGCKGNKPAEMTFSAGGSYSWTLPEDMFETKVTDSGAYRWDGDSGKLELGSRDYDGPFVPRLTASARHVDGYLTLTGWDPGYGANAACTIVLASG